LNINVVKTVNSQLIRGAGIKWFYRREKFPKTWEDVKKEKGKDIFYENEKISKAPKNWVPTFDEIHLVIRSYW
jgi:hypothetical protein